VRRRRRRRAQSRAEKLLRDENIKQFTKLSNTGRRIDQAIQELNESNTIKVDHAFAPNETKTAKTLLLREKAAMGLPLTPLQSAYINASANNATVNANAKNAAAEYARAINRLTTANSKFQKPVFDKVRERAHKSDANYHTDTMRYGFGKSYENQLKNLIRKQNDILLTNEEMARFALLTKQKNVRNARTKLAPSRDELKQKNEERLKRIRNKAESIRQRRPRWYQRYSAKNMRNINELIKEENKKMLTNSEVEKRLIKEENKKMLTNSEVEKRLKLYNQAMSRALAKKEKNVIESRSAASRRASASRQPSASSSRRLNANYKEFKRRGGRDLGDNPRIVEVRNNSGKMTVRKLRFVTPNNAYYEKFSDALEKMRQAYR
jgi:hypothetical protein